MGIETEYGVVEPGNPRANAMVLSSLVVAAHPLRSREGARSRWDYLDEDPLCDARGFRLDRAAAIASQLTDNPAVPAPSGDDDATTAAATGPSTTSPGADLAVDTLPAYGLPQDLPRPVGEYDDPGTANVICTNGARLYVDHAHPEYSSPEVTNPRDLVLFDRAGEQIMLDCMRALASSKLTPDVVLYKNNVDGKGATYGTHENYLVDRAVPFGDLIKWLTPFLVTRQIFCGAGRVGLGARSQEPGFQLSQRADYIEAEVGLETTVRRPIINTRDEPHADPALWRRLHVIAGDATLLEPVTLLRAGTTSLVLWLAEQATASRGRLPAINALGLADPVTAFHQVSRDLSLREPLALSAGGEMTALEIQRGYLETIRQALGQDVDPDTADVMFRWENVLDRLEQDPMLCAGDVEWVAKLQLLEGLRRRQDLPWDHPKLAAIDLQWSDLRPERGLYCRLRAAGAVDVIVDDTEVEEAKSRPPADTRAYFRGEVIARYGEQVGAASWDSVVFDVPGVDRVYRVPMRDPLRGTQMHVGALLDESPDALSLLRALGVQPGTQ